MLQDELEDANRGLDEFDRLYPEARKIFIAGNHEQRLQRYIFDRCPALFNVVPTVDNLLKLHQRGRWEYVPYGKHIRIGKMLFTHGTLARAHTAAAMLVKYEHNVCFGHIHRIEEALKVNALGEAHVAFTPGWLGDEAQMDYIQDFANWVHGFAIVYHLADGTFHHTIHKIVGGRTVVHGKLFRVTDEHELPVEKRPGRKTALFEFD